MAALTELNFKLLRNPNFLPPYTISITKINNRIYMKGHLTVVPLTFVTYDITDSVQILCHGHKYEYNIW